jgi:hypothetical protein
MAIVVHLMVTLRLDSRVKKLKHRAEFTCPTLESTISDTWENLELLAYYELFLIELKNEVVCLRGLGKKLLRLVLFAKILPLLGRS